MLRDIPSADAFNRDVNRNENRVPGFLRLCRFRVEQGIEKGLWRAALYGPLSLGLSVGIQWMLVALIFWGPLPALPTKTSELTFLGASWFHPERDLFIYLIGCVLTVLGTIGLVWLWKSDLRAQPASQMKGFAIASATAQLLLSVTSLVLFEIFLPLLRPLAANVQLIPSSVGLALLLIPGLCSLIIGAFGLRFVVSRVGLNFGKNALEAWASLSRSASQDSLEPNYRIIAALMDVLIVLLVSVIIYVPPWRELTGWLFRYDEFHHWDYFAVGPTLGFSHHRALGTEVYAQYGVGWPMLLNVIAPIAPLSYGLVIHIAIIYGCVYFAGIYLLLRLFLKNAAWAMTGVFVAIALQLFHGIEPRTVLWQYPSSSIIRAPFDVWFFTAVLMYMRSQRIFWGFLTGLIAGLSLLFETETGLYLCAVCACFFFVSVPFFVSRNLKRHFRAACVSGVTALVVSCLGLVIASRGTLLHAKFWVGWSEAIFKYSAGIGMLPIAGVPNTTLLLFATFLVIYLFSFNRMLITSLVGESSASDLFLGCLSLYGIFTLILFVGRSHPYNIYHASVPFAVILVASLARLHDRLLIRFDRLHPAIRYALPLACAAGTCVALFSQSAFQNYPNLFWTLRHGFPREGLSLSHTGIQGLPESARSFADEFDVMTTEIRTLAKSGKSIAIFDYADTKYYLASGTIPWSRYSPLMPFLMTKAQVEEVKNELLRRCPDYVFLSNDLRRVEARGQLDTWIALRNTLEEHHLHEGDEGMFEVWHFIR